MSSRGLNTNQIGLVSGFGNSDPKDSNHMRFQIGSVWIRMEGSFMYSEPLGLSEKILYTNRRARFGWWFGAIPSFFGFRSLEAENIFRWGWVFDEMMTRWWFQICVMFTCSWGHDPIWRPHIFQMGCSHRLRINPNTRENEKRNERLELWQRWCVIFLGQRDLASRPSKHGLWQIFQSEPGQRDLASRPSKHGLWQIFQSEPGQRDLASRPSKHGLFNQNLTTWLGQIFQSEPGQRDLASRPSTFAFLGNRESLQGSDALPGALGHLAIGELSRKGGKGGSKRRQQKGASFFSYLLHPGRLTCNLRIHPWKRKIIFQTIIFRFYVNLPGRKHHSNTVVSWLVKENGSKNWWRKDGDSWIRTPTLVQ